MNGETRILLLRHAETAAPDRFHGAESDVGLGKNGQAQAESVAAMLAALRPQALYCSAMRRAIETAEPIGRACGLVPQRIAALHERRIGPLSGRLRDEGWHTYDEAKTRWMAGDLEHTHPGGESYADIRDRVVPEVLAITARHPGQTVAIVAHGVVIRVVLTSLVEALSHADFSRVGIEFVGIHDLRWDGKRWRLADLAGADTPT